ncbi:MAG: hypothetical protein AAGD10_06210 [Myxococcota bacterium]
MARWGWLLLGLGACAGAAPEAPLEQVGRQVQGVRRELALCYHDARVAGAKVRGQDFVVTIDFAETPPSLRVRDAEAVDPELQLCVLAVLRELDFAPMDGTTVDVPIRAPR